MLAALILGLAIPVGIVYLHDLLKYKIENREDVEAITGVAILAELPLVKKTGEGSIVVRENKNDLMEEMFRGLRTNLLFMLGKDERVILFSSTQPGEGKSFVAGNLAVSLAYLGKRVVVVGMDIRIVAPLEFQPEAWVVEIAQSFAEKTGAKITITDDVAAASLGLQAAERRRLAAIRAFELVAQREREGLVNQLTFLDARAELTRAELNRIITGQRLFTAAAALDRATALSPLP